MNLAAGSTAGMATAIYTTQAHLTTLLHRFETFSNECDIAIVHCEGFALLFVHVVTFHRKDDFPETNLIPGQTSSLPMKA